MFEDSEKEKLDEMRFQAGIHGIDLNKEIAKQKKTKGTDGLVFGDPKEYEKMSKQERKDKTTRMMNKFKPWAGSGQTSLGKVKVK